MAYQSLYRRYRPRRFAEVRGQEHLVRALRNAVAEDRVGHAYLLSGPRGTGKTSTARILAKVLNCERPQDGEPCCECPSCLTIEAGTSFDLHELDAASNRGIDEMRSLLDSAALGTPGRTKVYILDEVHMLTPQASAALLKTLEEPPTHVVFVLATTDPQKVLPTIRSRTQHFELGLLSADELATHVRYVADDAGLEVSDEQLEYVVRKGAGSARDTLSALDQVVAAGGVPDEHEALDVLMAGLIEQDAAGVLHGVHEQLVAGCEPRVLGETLLVVLRNAFLSSMGADLSHLSDTDQRIAADHAQRLGARTLTRALEALGGALVEMRQAADPRIPLEVALIRIARPDADQGVDALVERIDRLERALSQGGAAEGAVAPAPAAGPRPAGRHRSPDRSPPESPTAPPEARAEGESRGGRRPEGADAEAASSEPDPAAPPAPPGGGGSRPADGAREVLARTGRQPGERGPAPRDTGAPSAIGGRSALAAHRGGRSTPSPPPPDDRPPDPARDSGADGPDAGGTASADSSPRSGSAGGPASTDSAVAVLAEAHPPTRDELTLAWGDSVLGALSQAARTRFRDGRFLDVEGEVAVFALPSEIHVKRADERRVEVEEALATQFGLRVRIRLVAETPGPVETSGGKDVEEPEEDVGPIEELSDAHDLAETHLQRITEAFPGAEVLDEGGPPS